MMSDAANYYILRKLEAQPEITQRQLAKELGISLGKVNYCLKALIAKGLVKVRNFKGSKNKKAYIYVLTPKGMEDKAATTKRFLKRKIKEYEVLRLEIDSLRQDLDNMEFEAEQC